MKFPYLHFSTMKTKFACAPTKNKIRILCMLILFSLQIQKAISQSWSDVGGGMCDWVNASVVYNGELVVGGRFTCAGGVPANYIAKWNGTSWSALGTGLNGWVNALTVYNGDLIAGGTFSQAGSTTVNYLAKWDGSTWSGVSGDMGSTVAALTVYNNDLIVGGYFTDADGFPANYIVGYNNTVGWFDLGSGMGGSQGQVMALQVYGTDLIAAGFFTTAGGATANHIAKWNGISWSSLGSGIAWITYSLGMYNGDLIAGGYYSTAGGISANSIARWNGTSWSALGSGMGATGVGYNYVFALAEYNGSLYAGGMFLTAGGITANGIARWDGNTWSDLQGGVWYGGSNAYGVNTLCVYGNELYAGGLFTSAGSTGVAHLAKWTVITGIHAPSANNKEFFLDQNIPNPFSRRTVIHYHVPAQSKVRLTVYDCAGRELKTIVNETKMPGIYDVPLDATGFAAGFYYYKMEAGSFSEMRRMLLMKDF